VRLLAKRLRAEAGGFWRAGRLFYEHHGFDRAAALAFWALIAFVPFLLMFFGIFGTLVDFLERPEDRMRLLSETVAALRQVFPDLNQGAISYLETLVAERDALSATGVPLFLLTTLAFYGTLEDALAMVFHPGRTRSLAKSKLVGLAFLSLAIVALVAAAIAALTLSRLIGGDAGLMGRVARSGTGAVALEILVFAAAFAVLVRWFALERIRWRLLAAGGLVFGALWMVARALFALYLRTIAPYGLVYGSLATIVVILVWAYYSGVIFLYAAERVAIWRATGRDTPGSG
jgi:membrane protein